jgi:replicative DNA helicase
MGLKPGVHVIAAGPNIGKTTFTLNIINNILQDAARRNEQRVGAVISMEMGVESLTTKMLATRARLSTRDIEAGTLTSEQRRTLMLAGQELGQQGLYFVEGFNAITPQAIEAKIQHIRAMRGRFDFLVVDYLQLLDPNRSNSSRYDATTDNSRDLTRMAHKYQIPILLISQLSREHVREAQPGLHPV